MGTIIRYFQGKYIVKNEKPSNSDEYIFSLSRFKYIYLKKLKSLGRRLLQTFFKTSPKKGCIRNAKKSKTSSPIFGT